MGLSGNDIHAMLPFLQLETFPTSTYIFNEGDVSDRIFIIYSGSVALCFNNMSIVTFNKGNTFGEVGVVEQGYLIYH